MSQPTDEQFFETLVKQAVEFGATLLEYFTCECGKDSLVGHYWSEVVTCTHCGTKRPSRVPRLPALGEPTVEHYVAAIGTLTQCYANVPNHKFITNEEWKALDPRVQALLTVNMSAAAIAVLKQVAGLAETLAALPAKK
jgi:hypothetical protein